ncbi:SDR family oxidoreductase [Marinimicrobium sp. ABcell2]|uniref:SDR family oxidoreductase n=1 Tax=Marinimicrobium sp. ABcell2 TaxID=3069751 RepID=UPI0027B0777B|nr:SDR family oxidoreductase [Marinimicrobium sp. ABcell2]MDQ2075756.1 SDR family oxidoreductase [Marinimicrobium sp. ABcell2]
MAKTVLITGASSGFGAACAEKFAEAGHNLILLARRLDRLETLQHTLQDRCQVHIDRLDVTDSSAVSDVLNRLPSAFKNIDILINNAGLALGLDPAHSASLEDWETMVNTNILGLLRVTHQILPGMVAKDSGHIVNIGSTAGSWPYPGGNVYGATKSFVQTFSRQLRADLLGKHIRVSNIDPGLAETEFSQVRFKNDREQATGVYKGTQPLTAKDIAEIVFWVTSVPPHININALEVMPVCQAWGPLSVDREMG